MEIFYLQKRGVHKLAITDTEKTRTFGHKESNANSSNLEKFVIRFSDADKRPIGLDGRWKNSGLTALGIITMNTQCIPEDGEYVEPGKVETVKEIVYVEVEKQLPAPDPIVITKDADPTGIIIAVVVVFAVLIIVNIILCICCIRRDKKRIESLETEKKADWTMHDPQNLSPRKSRLVTVGDALPDEESFSGQVDFVDDSARRPLYVDQSE